ncbi:tRNA3(Ser)-specific nuclease WapA precursor [Stieleria neptunia]|uniref:tRNA3(Ser)-specific nuclease WapA n=1 Tax=Stieleria neptunia TaxID=2527979 RepID=A0A518HUD2_9BACT|nr:RHS repeat-associated core domain-containing protein [Stieleria neptunia]QDV44436.1 tRNA3(Ser)-specific nuclease WapA precursor [Stieleria neptunia]
MLCKPSSRRRTLQRRLARRRAGGVKSCADSKRIRSCKTLRQQTCSPDKSRTESDKSTIKFAFRYHGTQQYSVTALTDSSGTIKERYAYDAYGGLSIFDGSGTARTSTAEGNRYTYTGREYDDVLDLYHYRARMYDPIAGRFCSRDPIGYAGRSLSLYLFVGSNALKFVDPFGLKGTVTPPSTPVPWWPSTPIAPNPNGPRPGPTTTPLPLPENIPPMPLLPPGVQLPPLIPGTPEYKEWIKKAWELHRRRGWRACSQDEEEEDDGPEDPHPYDKRFPRKCFDDFIIDADYCAEAEEICIEVTEDIEFCREDVYEPCMDNKFKKLRKCSNDEPGFDPLTPDPENWPDPPNEIWPEYLF